jgi:sulfopyruvate decarboxylase alpha subunit
MYKKPCLNLEEKIIGILKKYGYNFSTILPCGKVKYLYNAILHDSSFTVVEINREEEGFGICAGAYFAGKKPFMLIQSTGLSNSFNAIFSLILTYQIPLLVLVSYRGYYDEKVMAQKMLGENLKKMLDVSKIKNYIVDKNLNKLETACSGIIIMNLQFVCCLRSCSCNGFH